MDAVSPTRPIRRIACPQYAGRVAFDGAVATDSAAERDTKRRQSPAGVDAGGLTLLLPMGPDRSRYPDNWSRRSLVCTRDRAETGEMGATSRVVGPVSWIPGEAAR